MQYHNPIISGYNPDPTICRVGEDFYIMNSTFEFFPGVPIYHSKNLVNWELINFALKTESQLPLKGCRASGGIYAPTLRYHEGTFFMTTTNVSGKGNFIVHTDDIRGDWSEPAWVAQGGIDPTLLFDDDGKVYFCSTGSDTDGVQAICMCEVDPFTGQMLTKTKPICRGTGGRFVEGPHLYKINGQYYLMAAEGGTEYGHMETIFRSDSPWGPYEGCPHNPILTHRDTMKEDIKCTGHADLVEDQNGNWWLVALGIRPLVTETNRVLLHNLGRETFLAPLTWDEEGWPHVGNNGMFELTMEGPLPGETPKPVNRDFKTDFEENKLSPHITFIRNPYRQNYILQPEKSSLLLKGTEKTLSCPNDSPTFVGVRQKEFHICAAAKMKANPLAERERCGISAYYNDSYHYDLFLTKKSDGFYVCLNKRIHDMEAVTNEQKLDFSGEIELRIESDMEYYAFSYRERKDRPFTLLGKGLAAGLCTEGTHTMTFTGVFIGLYAVNTEAEFDSFQVLISE